MVGPPESAVGSWLQTASSCRRFSLSVGVEALPDFQAAVGRGRLDAAGLCAAGIRRLPAAALASRRELEGLHWALSTHSRFRF